jgi:small subunit ribosomal protein S9
MAELQQYYATGMRKTSVARVWVRPGDGEVTINRKPFDRYLTRQADRAMVLEPLKITNSMNKYNVVVNVKGGGVSGQTGAMRHGISRALVEANPQFRDILKKEGLLTRDPRMKERKKYGQPGARARFQYSKR